MEGIGVVDDVAMASGVDERMIGADGTAVVSSVEAVIAGGVGLTLSGGVPVGVGGVVDVGPSTGVDDGGDARTALTRSSICLVAGKGRAKPRTRVIRAITGQAQVFTVMGYPFPTT